MAEKVTVMVLKVDLQCPCCYKKVKKLLCKFPQIRDQIYNEKANTVTITVVCCSPEKLRDKLCCKGGKVIKSIEIVEPPKPKTKPKDPEKPKEEPKKPDKKVTIVEPPKETEKPPPPAPVKTPAPVKPPAPVKQPPPAPEPAPTPPPAVPVQPPAYPPRTCCGPCSEGYGGGPCYYGFGVAPPPPPQPCFDGYGYGYGYHDRPCHVTRCDYYFSEENPQSCSIM